MTAISRTLLAITFVLLGVALPLQAARTKPLMTTSKSNLRNIGSLHVKG